MYKFLLLLLLFPTWLTGQEYPLDQSSPQSTLYKHYYYLSEGNYSVAHAAQTFGYPDENNRQLAVSLRQILDGKGLIPKFENYPAKQDYTDSISHLHEFRPFIRYPEIYLEKKGNKWYFSERTKDYIPRLHQEIFPFGSGWLIKLLPEHNSGQFWGIKSWQWLGILLLLLIGFLLHKIFTWIIERITRRLIQSTSVPKAFRIAVHQMAIPFSYLFLVQFLDWLYPSLMLPASIGRFVNLAFRIVEPIFLTIALYRLVDVIALILKRRAEKTETSLDDQLVPLFRKSLKVLMVIFGILVLLKNLDFNLTALIAGVSIGGLAFALAAQDTIKNMFGSLMIFVDKPFQIGDLVSLEGATGKIEEVGFRSTRIRTLDSSVITIPNGKVVDMMIDNLGSRTFRRFKTNLAISCNTPPEKVKAFIHGIREIAGSHPDVWTDALEVMLSDINNNSLIISVTIHFWGNEGNVDLKNRQEILLQVLELAEKMEISLAPTLYNPFKA